MVGIVRSTITKGYHHRTKCDSKLSYVYISYTYKGGFTNLYYIGRINAIPIYTTVSSAVIMVWIM